MTGPPVRIDQVYGTWRLVEANAVSREGVEIRRPYGPAPMGRLVLTQSGRMMAVICDGRPAVPDGEVRAYASYCGNYVVEDGRLITTIDAAAISERIGDREVRKLELRSGRLVLIPPRRQDGEQREIIWERDGPP
jgi:hypothetical protein